METQTSKHGAQSAENTRTSYYVAQETLDKAKKIAKKVKARSFSAWCVDLLKRKRGLTM